MNIVVREAVDDDHLEVRRVLDAAMLDVRDDLEARIETGDVLVADEKRRSDEENEPSDDRPILGALVLVPSKDSAHIDAVAVRRARRGRGVGSELVQTAAEHHPRLTAEFDADVRPFYESLGFAVSAVETANPSDGDRLRGRYVQDWE